MDNDDELLYWLLRAYIAWTREGWEPGPSGDEVFLAIHDVLTGHDIAWFRDDPPTDERKRRALELLRRYDCKEWRAP